MKNRIFLTLMAAVTALTMSTAGVYATDKLEKNASGLIIDDFYADTECITIYPSAEINLMDLQAAVTLKEDGALVPVTVEEVSVHDSNLDAFDYVANGNYLQAKSYKIKKADDFKTDVAYEMIIDGLSSADNSLSLEKEYKKLFKLETLFEDDFSGDASKWTLVQETGNSLYFGNNEIAVEDGVLKVMTGDTHPYMHTLTVAGWQQMSACKDYTVQFDIKALTDIGGGWHFNAGLSTGVAWTTITSQKRFAVRGDNYVNVTLDKADNGTWSNDANVNALDATYKLVAKGNKTALYIDGIKYADYTSDLEAKGVFGILFQTSGCEYEIDNVIMTKVVDCVLASTDKDEYDITEDVILTLDSAYNPDTLNKEVISVFADDEPVTDFDVIFVDEYSFKIHFTNPLLYKTNYKIIINNTLEAAGKTEYKYADVNFKTIEPAFDLESFTNESGILTAKIKNNREENPVKCLMTIVLYDAQNKMIGIDGGEYEIAKGDNATLTMNAKSNAVKAKCYVWDNFSSMNTLYEKTIVIE